jgi:pimeloyl-ACP methyl ester carboxylesterase
VPDDHALCGTPRDVAGNDLGLRAWEWGRAGDPPVVLLHSMAAHGHWWDWTAPRLAGRFHVVALDFRGHGESQWAEPAAYRFADHVGDVVAALDALGWRAPVVIGHSLGSYVGAYLAALHPDRVSRLVIADMLTFWTEEMAATAERQASRPPPTFSSRAEVAARFRLVPPETSAPAEWLRHLAEAGAVERRPGVWEPAFDRQVFLHSPIDPWPFLPGVGCPTLVVRGERSPLMDRDQWLRVTTAVQHGQFAEMRAAAHHLILDDPPQFVSIVERWLAGA